MSISTPRAQLVFIAADHNAAEQLIEQLRARGALASGSVLPDAEQLHETIERRGGDLIVYLGDGQEPPLDPLITACAALPDPRPLVLAAEPQAIAGLIAATDAEAVCDVVPRTDIAHLERALQREFSSLLQRRHLARLEQLLADCEQRGRELATVASTGIAFVQDGLHLNVNPAYPALFGYATPEAILPIPLLDLFAEPQRQKVRELLRQAKEQADKPSGHYGEEAASAITLNAQRLDGNGFLARLLAAPARYEDEPCVRVLVQSLEATATNGLAHGVEQTADDRHSRLARALATIDARLDSGQAAGRMTPRIFAILAVQIRESTRLLRELGPSSALAAFDRFGDRLVSLTDAAASCTRLSDDTFVLLADDLDEAAAQRLAAKVVRQSHLPERPAPCPNDMPDAAVGWLVVGGTEDTAEELLDKLYQLCRSTEQTRSVRNAQADEPDETALLQQIDLGLRRKRLRHVYQPIVSLHGDDLQHYTARVDLLDARDNLLEARRFMDVAIRHGRSGEIDHWSIREAMQTLSKQHQAGTRLSLFVGLTEASLHDPDTALRVHDWLQEFGVKGRWLTFQLAETLVRGNQAVAGKLIEALHAKQCRIALGQFGLEANPESLLQHLALDYLILHQDIARSLTKSRTQQQRLTRFVALTREFKLKSIVTGIEDASALPILWTAGVNFVQGDFLQPPSPLLGNH